MCCVVGDDSLLISDTSCLIGASQMNANQLQNLKLLNIPQNHSRPLCLRRTSSSTLAAFLHSFSLLFRVALLCLVVASQNVMLQMGLRLISVSGLSITSSRQFLLKCHACFHLTRDMQRQFCPACGLHTLIRATLVLTTDPLTHTTTARIYHGTRHLNKRGTRYSIPKARGGRGGGGLKLAEDVMAGFGRKPRDGGTKSGGAGGVEAMYDAGVEFGLGHSGRHVRSDTVGYGRKNPNEVKKRTGNKKKRA